jgi:hypothetical protein
MIIPKKLPKDPNQRAHQIARMLTEGPRRDEIATERSPLSAYMAEIGRKGGLKGGAARRDKMSPRQRKESAKKAAAARWEKT